MEKDPEVRVGSLQSRHLAGVDNHKWSRCQPFHAQTLLNGKHVNVANLIFRMLDMLDLIERQFMKGMDSRETLFIATS